MSTGLFLGKLAPLHEGHQYCIETALKKVDDLYILIYNCPDVTDVPLITRANWIRELYPEVTVLEAWVAPMERGYTDHMKAKHESYIANKLEENNITNIDVFFSSEPYGTHMAESLGAEDFRVDQKRNLNPISATQIREWISSNKYSKVQKSVDKLVYKDLVTNVAVLGGTSTGKTTLCKQLASEYSTKWQPEVGREFWNEHADENGLLTKKELYELACKHLKAEEEKLAEANKYLFTDTNAITTGMFSKIYHNDIHPKLEQLMLENISRYDVFILCNNDIPFEDEPGREGSDGSKQLQRMYKSWLRSHEVPYYMVEESVKNRVEQVGEILCEFSKWNTQRN